MAPEQIVQRSLDAAAAGGGITSWWVIYAGVVNQTIGAVAGLLSIAFIVYRWWRGRKGE